jgi:putative ABC transport system ATP-binding protein
MLELAAVSKAYEDDCGRVEVLAGVDLRVDPGELVCLYGASGSGKTTLLHLAAGLDTPDSGSVRIDGEDIAAESEAARARLRLSRIGVVFQRDNLIPELSAWENVALPLLGLGRPRAEARDLSMSALESVGMVGLADRAPNRLSGGERQRVGIARGIVGERSLLVADEPTGALDSANSTMLFELLRELASSAALAVLIATHDPLAVPLATHALTIRDGRLSAA